MQSFSSCAETLTLKHQRRNEKDYQRVYRKFCGDFSILRQKLLDKEDLINYTCIKVNRDSVCDHKDRHGHMTAYLSIGRGATEKEGDTG